MANLFITINGLQHFNALHPAPISESRFWIEGCQHGFQQNRINHKQPRLQLLACFVPTRNNPVHQVWPVSRPLLNCSLTRLVPAACQWSQKQFHKSRTQTTICQLQGLQIEKADTRKHPIVLVVCTWLLRTLEIARCTLKRWSLWHPREKLATPHTIQSRSASAAAGGGTKEHCWASSLDVSN